MYAVQTTDLGGLLYTEHREYRNPNTALRAAMTTNLSPKYEATPIAFQELEKDQPISIMPIPEVHALMHSDRGWYRVAVYHDVSGVEQVQIRKLWLRDGYRLIAVEEI